MSQVVISNRQKVIIVCTALLGAVVMGLLYGLIAAAVGLVCGAAGGTVACLIEDFFERARVRSAGGTAEPNAAR